MSLATIVKGNTFSLAIPLQVYAVEDGEVVLRDYTPESGDAITIRLKGDRRNYTYIPATNGNTAFIHLEGSEVVGVYAVEVEIVKDDDSKLTSMRFEQLSIVESIDELNEGQITEGIEQGAIYLDPEIFIAGKDGRGVVSIAKTATSGLVDTYTITYTDATTSTFNVTNGKDGINGQDGADGVGIASIAKTGTQGLVDTYTITMTNGTTYTYQVTNGKNGENGRDGADGQDGTDGVGIVSITKTSTSGLVDTYTILLTNGTTTTFTVTNGKDGVDLGLVEIADDLTTDDPTQVLSARQGVVLKGMIGKILNTNDNTLCSVWVGSSSEFDALGGVYDDNTIYLVGTKYTEPVVESIGHSSIGRNSEQFVAVTDPVGEPVVWSVVATPSGSATINSSTGVLTILADCSVIVTATCGNSSLSTSGIPFQYQNDPDANIVFEDANVKLALLTAMGKSADGEITYGEASEWDPSATQQNSIFTNYKTGNNAITKFNEWKYFPHMTNANCVSDATSLVEVLFPPLSKLSNTGSRIYNIGATDLVVPCSEVGVKAVDSCSSLVSLKFTSRLAAFSNSSNGAVYSCSALRTVDMSECTFTTGTQSRFIMDCTNLYIVKLPSSLETMSGQILRGCSNVKYLVIGDAVNGSDLTSFSTSLYNGPANLEIVLYAPYVAGQITAFATESKAFAKLYVPDDDVDAYKADSVFSTYASKIYGISELPSGWDTPPTT